MTRRFLHAITALAALLTSSLAIAGEFSTSPTFLPVHEAFKVSATGTPDAVQVHFVAAPGYYLYKSKLSFSVSGTDVTAGDALLPDGELKSDPYFGDVLVYHGAQSARVPVINHGGGAFTLRVGFQGCAEKGLCYPPDYKEIRVTKNAGTATTAGWSWWRIVLAFAAGLGFAFTPWALTATPVLNATLLQNGLSFQRRASRGLAFAATFLSGYTVINASIVWLSPGVYIQGALQTLLVLAPCTATLLALAVRSTPPVSANQAIGDQYRLPPKTLAVFLGLIASIVVTPYVPESLASSMLYLRAGGEKAGGLMEIIAFALGMAGPQIMLGICLTELVSRSRPWMTAFKLGNGVVLCVVAIWAIGRVLPGPLTLGLYGVLAVGIATSLGVFRPRDKSPITLVLAGLALVVGVSAWIGMLKGESDPMNPLGFKKGDALVWTVVSKPDRLAAVISEAKTAGSPAVVDWYADWAATTTFSAHAAASQKIRSALRGIKLIRVDVSQSSASTRAMLELNGLMGPGAVQFFDLEGTEATELRLVGASTEQKILNSITGLTVSTGGRPGPGRF